MSPIVIQTGFSPTLPPRRACATALRHSRSAGKPPVCCACTVECEPDGELRVQMVFQDGRTRSLESPSASRRSMPPPISAWIDRWIRWRG